MINVFKPQAKARMQRRLLRQMLQIEKGFAKRVRILLNGSYREAAHLLEQGISQGLDAVVDLRATDMIQIFRIGYIRAGGVFSKLVFDAVAQLKFSYAPEAKGMADEFWNSFRSYVELNTASRVLRVNGTTKRWIARLIKRGTENGKSPGEIAKDLRKSGRLNKNRATRIARTEVHSVSNYATQKAAESTRLKLEKEWVAFIDDRTRTSHIKVNGQKVLLNNDFEVGGARMKQPGDPKGGAKNVIHCRCVVLYHTVKNRYKII